MSPDQNKAARELLAFYAEAGVDAAIGEAAKDRLSEPEPDAAPTVERPRAEAPRNIGGPAPARTADPRLSAPPARPAPPPTPDAAVMAAREAARGAASLDELRAILDRFEGCSLKGGASRLVFADGTPGSRLMFVGEAPGAEEDRQGLPFVGRAGALLTELLDGIGLRRDDVFITNTVRCRPPGNRDPDSAEIEACSRYMYGTVELIEPHVIATLGNFATKLLTGSRVGITRVRGTPQVRQVGARTVFLMPLLHPAAALRTPSLVDTLRADFAKLPDLLVRELPADVAAPAEVAAVSGPPDPAAEQLDLLG
jgi:DNA polymerase